MQLWTRTAGNSQSGFKIPHIEFVTHEYADRNTQGYLDATEFKSIGNNMEDYMKYWTTGNPSIKWIVPQICLKITFLVLWLAWIQCCTQLVQHMFHTMTSRFPEFAVYTHSAGDEICQVANRRLSDWVRCAKYCTLQVLIRNEGYIYSSNKQLPLLKRGNIWRRLFPGLRVVWLNNISGVFVASVIKVDDWGSKDLWNFGRLLPEHTTYEPIR
jgi:hypothetical protein